MHETPAFSGDDTRLPDTVRRYQDAHDRHDTDIALSAFGPDAAVFDDGKEFHGTDEVVGEASGGLVDNLHLV